MVCELETAQLFADLEEQLKVKVSSARLPHLTLPRGPPFKPVFVCLSSSPLVNISVITPLFQLLSCWPRSKANIHSPVLIRYNLPVLIITEVGQAVLSVASPAQEATGAGVRSTGLVPGDPCSKPDFTLLGFFTWKGRGLVDP